MNTAQPTQHPFTITQSALADFCRISGREQDAAARDVLQREFQAAHYVATLDSGAQRWKGRRPRRLTFVVHVEAGRMYVGRVWPEHQGVRVQEQYRKMDLRIDGKRQSFDVLDLVYEQGGERRVAFKLVSGVWLEACRGPRPGVVTGAHLLPDAPEWAEKPALKRGA